jgi:hypothetical protein
MNPKLPQFVAMPVPASFPSTSAASAPVGSARQRLTM